MRLNKPKNAVNVLGVLGVLGVLNTYTSISLKSTQPPRNALGGLGVLYRLDGISGADTALPGYTAQGYAPPGYTRRGCVRGTGQAGRAGRASGRQFCGEPWREVTLEWRAENDKTRELEEKCQKQGYQLACWILEREFSRQCQIERDQQVLRLAERGWPVFPCRPRSKVPAVSWTTEATRDPEWLRHWCHQVPSANWAIVTGPASGVFVLDVDGEAGLESLSRLSESWRYLSTLGVRTPHGSHLYWKYPADRRVPNSQGRVGSGLDVRGSGGYVLAPPSAGYSWLSRFEGAPVAEAPAWLLELAVQRRKHTAMVVPAVELCGRRLGTKQR